jgi:hypothetical protein
VGCVRNQPERVERRVAVFMVCVVCGTRTRECVTLVRTLETVPLCSSRCQRLFLQYPWQFVDSEEAEAETTAGVERS